MAWLNGTVYGRWCPLNSKIVTRQIPSMPGHSVTRGGVVYDPHGQRCLNEIRQSTHQKILYWQRRNASNELISFVPVHRTIIEAWYNDRSMLFPQDGNHLCIRAFAWETAIVVPNSQLKAPKSTDGMRSGLHYDIALTVWHAYQYMHYRANEILEKCGLIQITQQDVTKIIETIVVAGIRR